MKVLFYTLAFLSLAGCPRSPPDDPVQPRPTPVPVDTQFCDAAEANLIKLGCPEGKPTSRGVRFGDVCRELHQNGVAINPRCLATIKSCSEVDVCTGTVNAPRSN